MKNEKKFFLIFFIQDIAWDIQKCLLEVFVKNLFRFWKIFAHFLQNFCKMRGKKGHDNSNFSSAK